MYSIRYCSWFQASTVVLERILRGKRGAPCTPANPSHYTSATGVMTKRWRTRGHIMIQVEMCG